MGLWLGEGKPQITVTYYRGFCALSPFGHGDYTILLLMMAMGVLACFLVIMIHQALTVKSTV